MYVINIHRLDIDHILQTTFFCNISEIFHVLYRCCRQIEIDASNNNSNQFSAVADRKVGRAVGRMSLYKYISMSGFIDYRRQDAGCIYSI